ALVNERVPEIRPVAVATASDGGSPVVLYVNAVPSGSVATSCSETIAFSALVWLAGAVSVGARLTLVAVHGKVLLPGRVPSDSVAVTLPVPALVNERVPEIRPVAVVTVSDGGSPVALYVNAPPSGSLATSCRETAVFSALVWFAGAVSV